MAHVGYQLPGKPKHFLQNAAGIGRKSICDGKLLGKLANICADLPSSHLAGTSVFKAITGGDPIMAEYKGGELFEFVPFCRLLFSANHPPQSPDASEAFFRRWLVIPFDRKFEGKNAIPRRALDARLSAPSELSGMLNKAIAAWHRMEQTHRFTESGSTQAALGEFRATTDPLGVWLDRFTIEDPYAFVPRRTLRIAYNAECERRGRPPMTDTAFGTAIARLRPNVEAKQRTVGGKRQHCYIGLELIHGGDDAQSAQGSQGSHILTGSLAKSSNEEGNEDEDEEVEVAENRENPVHPVHLVHPESCKHEWIERPDNHGEAQVCRLCGRFYGYLQKTDQLNLD